MDWQKDEYLISTDKSRLDAVYVHQFLSKESYWAQHIPFAIVERSIANSLCFGLYQHERQIGFARLITDEATFGYLADVFIDAAYRGKKLGTWLIEAVMEHPSTYDLRRIMLATKDAQNLYKQFGFDHPADLTELMYVRRPDIYKRKAGLL